MASLNHRCAKRALEQCKHLLYDADFILLLFHPRYWCISLHDICTIFLIGMIPSQLYYFNSISQAYLAHSSKVAIAKHYLDQLNPF
ncbi:hypothetical protein FGO68_gene12326 [Halteria grandinella]|uniref:Uncharacterized protein n=1 Tax=Halteria grandinella TaxID=5974 RepID=A0A8J8T610_HALGN|nr:hypothetical protein FGO68_gene12326 [Halteria grandinella]